MHIACKFLSDQSHGEFYYRTTSLVERLFSQFRRR